MQTIEEKEQEVIVMRRRTREEAFRRGKECGANAVEISAHAICAPDHLPYQGRRFSFAEFEYIQASLKRPIGADDCMHSLHPIIMGISRPAYTEEMLEWYRFNSLEPLSVDGIVKTRYEWMMKIRSVEDSIRKRKQVIMASSEAPFEAFRRELQIQINELYAYRARMHECTGLSVYYRTHVPGFKPVKMPKPGKS